MDVAMAEAFLNPRLEFRPKCSDGIDEALTILLRCISADPKLRPNQRLELTTALCRNACDALSQKRSLATISLMAHELRTPLVTIRGYAEMMAKGRIGPLNQELVDCSRTMLRNSIQIQDTINTFVESCRNQDHIELRPTDVRSLIKTTARGFEDRAQKKNIVFEARSPAKDIEVMASPEKLKTALRALITSVIKTIHGRVELTCQEVGAQMQFSLTAFGTDPEGKGALLQAPGPEIQIGIDVATQIISAHGAELHSDTTPETDIHLWFRLPIV